MTKRVLAAIAAAVTVAAGAAACGAGTAVDSGKALVSALEKVAHNTDRAGSVQADGTTDLGAGEPVKMSGTYSWGKDGADLDTERDAKAAGMQDLVSRSKVRMLYTGGAYYYEVEPQASGPLAGEHWMKVDASALVGDQMAANATQNSSARRPRTTRRPCPACAPLGAKDSRSSR